MNFSLSGEERQILLAEAREAIAARLEGRQPRFQEHGAEKTGTPGLAYPCGAFVTLQKNGDLRGCIGRMSSPEPLFRTVRVMALEAAFGDPRFPPLVKGEPENCGIEISALSPLEPCADPANIEVGVHGLYLVHRGRAGVLLPQVPVEQGWNRDGYLDHICVKAGLPPRSWEAPGAKLCTFTAIVFGENEDARH